MNQPNLHLPSLTYHNDAGADVFARRYSLQSESAAPESAHRLIVLIPADADYIAATHRIWELAVATRRHVHLLGLCRAAAEEPRLHRQLVTLSALMGSGKVSTEMKIAVGTNWVEAVKTHYQAGDMIVCLAEPRVGFLQRPLNQILKENLNVSVYLLSNSHPERFKSNWFSQVVVWSGFIGIIIGFGILQIKIAQLPSDWFQNALFVLSLIPEFWLIWVWNNLHD